MSGEGTENAVQAVQEDVKKMDINKGEEGANKPQKLTKAQKKALRKAEKAAKKAEKAAKLAAQNAVKEIEVGHPDECDFGHLKLVQSAYKTDRKWTEVKDLVEESVGQKVWVRARVQTIRGKGKICFWVLRKGFSSCQVVFSAYGNEGDVSKEMVKYCSKVNPESVVDVYGEVVKPNEPVKSCTQSAIELKPIKAFIVHASGPVLPFQIEDASRRPLQEGQEAKQGDIFVSQDSRLNNRHIDLRTPANHAIFRIQAKVCQYFRQYFIDRDFVEIHSPKIIPGVSEGGSDVFKLQYFGRECCLAQSPQLYKQMGVVSDLFRVFEIGPVFRAENSNTHRHMCEFTGMDFEMEIKEHYHEALEYLGGVFVYMFKQLNANCQPLLEAVNKQYPFEPLKFRDETLILPYPEIVSMLRGAGHEIGDFDDMNTTQEKALGKLVRAKYDTDFYIVDRYPMAVRPFYTMPAVDDPNYSNSYDVFLRGEEITSGAQRIHDPELLTQKAKEAEIPIEGLASYIRSFEFGAFPHAGGGIGLERVVMLFLGLDNIRKSSMFPRTPNRCAP
jgi:aspartyl-tRNA synthetase